MSERCAWCGTDPLYVAYHDTEWGVPNHDDRHLFEMLVLEGAQAGLSWITILRKREHYRRAFDGFDAERVARYGEADLARLLADAGIVRNRLKIESAVANARATLAAQERFGSLDALLWRFAEGSAPTAPPRSLAEIPAQTAASQAMSRELKRLGFRFVGPTVCYAFMQAVGMVNDHVDGCFRQREIAAGRCATSPAPRP
ncbi:MULTISPECIES: DNA-3-methyladenine glycosylase I [Thauera]|uniref:DNA-3-methyladenine glycosylase I n=1 Tax=Thauera aminoaromatica S2 TaxID=1234381 RepID=N6Z516_THASP|nr:MULTISPECIES: DNA-3-methyladenine glycosylase I [Thauera]ENO87249.1 DNA-3-methyladenine glycosylase I [Thauera aminoaromatica S2]KIN90514.1 DNA-3-methyladenine glycosylase I family protein [Thauera sp. SWB20]